MVLIDLPSGLNKCEWHVSPPYPILARPERFRKPSLSPLPTLPGITSANPVLQLPSSQWRKPAQELTLSVVLKRARSQPCHWVGPWDRDLRPPKKKVASTSQPKSLQKGMKFLEKQSHNSVQPLANSRMPCCGCYCSCVFEWADMYGWANR